MGEVLKNWKPSDPLDARRKEPATEKGWEHSLVDHLRETMPEIQILPQAGAGMQRGDILVERQELHGASKLIRGLFDVNIGLLSKNVVRDIIELKQGLSSQSQFQRLVGQVELYLKEKDSYIFIVVCGDKVDKKLVQELVIRYKLSEKVHLFLKMGGRGIKKAA